MDRVLSLSEGCRHCCMVHTPAQYMQTCIKRLIFVANVSWLLSGVGAGKANVQRHGVVDGGSIRPVGWRM